MAERIVFHFEGALAEQHTLNFYEAARFQYATARLIVKLDQFRATGGFVKKITNSSNRNVLLQSQAEGSFDISILAPLAVAAKEVFINVPLKSLMSYVFERLVGKTSDSDVAKALNANLQIVRAIGQINENHAAQMSKALDIIQQDRALISDMHSENREVLERRIAELSRERDMASVEGKLSKIDAAREQRLLSMSAPLVSEMATVLRKSANTLDVITEGIAGSQNKILYLNSRMAEEIIVSNVDKEITPILGNIIQYNKETGWGKARLDISDQPLSFNMPSDIKGRLQAVLLAAMGKDKVYLQVYIVRDKVQEPSRLVIVGILPTPL